MYTLGLLIAGFIIGFFCAVLLIALAQIRERRGPHANDTDKNIEPDYVYLYDQAGRHLIATGIVVRSRTLDGLAPRQTQESCKGKFH